jgi:hypothetical protein
VIELLIQVLLQVKILLQHLFRRLLDQFQLNLLFSDFFCSRRVKQESFLVDNSSHFKVFLRFFALKEAYQMHINKLLILAELLLIVNTDTI